MGEARDSKRNEYGEAQENDVSRRAEEDRGCSARKVGKSQSEAEVGGHLKRARSAPSSPRLSSKRLANNTRKIPSAA